MNTPLHRQPVAQCMNPQCREQVLSRTNVLRNKQPFGWYVACSLSCAEIVMDLMEKE